VCVCACDSAENDSAVGHGFSQLVTVPRCSLYSAILRIKFK